MRTHPDIGLMTTSQQACSRRATTCAFLAVYISCQRTQRHDLFYCVLFRYVCILK